MKRNWWILTFLLGLASAGFVGWRVYSQRHEVERSQIEATVDGLKETIKLAKGQRSFNESAQWQMLANRFGAMLGENEESGKVHHKNRDSLIYLQGLANYKASVIHLKEALGDRGGVADPRPETFLNAWDSITKAVSNPNFDIPTTQDDSRYGRFLSIVDDDLLIADRSSSDTRNRVLSELGLVVEEIKDGEGHTIKSADQYALARIGVKVDKALPSDGSFSTVALGNKLPLRQLDFLMHRLMVADELKMLNDRMIQRFVELDMPECAWQFLSVLVQDKQVGPYILRNSFGAVIDAQRQHLAALARWSSAPESDLLHGVLEQSRANYKQALSELERKVQTGVTSAQSALPRLEELRDTYRDPSAMLARLEATYKDFNADAYRDLISDAYEGEDLDYMVDVEKRRIADCLKELESLRKPREMAIYEAMEMIERLGDRILKAGEHRSDIAFEGADLEAKSLPVDLVTQLVSGSGLSDINSISVKHFGSSPEALNAFREALRDVMLADVSVIQARAARMMNDHKTSEEILGSLDGEEFGKINRAFSIVVGGLEDLDEDGDGVAGEEAIKTPERVGASFAFLDRRIKEFNERASLAEIGDNTRKRYFTEMANEMTQVRSSLERASFEHAELTYQVMLSMLRELTGPDRPYVPRDLALNYGADHRSWLRSMESYLQEPSGDKPEHPLNDPFMKNEPSYQALADLVGMELAYRRQFDLVKRLYSQFLDSPEGNIRLRANFGLASAELDDLVYNFDWKWRFANTRPSHNDHPAQGYGPFAWVTEGTKLMKANGYPFEGQWLTREEANDYRRRGVSRETFYRIEGLLKPLAEITPSQAPDLYVGVMLRSGQLHELFTPDDRTRDQRFSMYDYEGDLPAAVRDYYIPLLRDKSRVTDASLIQNRYIPLQLHFESLNRKLWRWMNSVDQRSEPDLLSLFGALTPTTTRRDDINGISALYSDWLAAVSERQPGIMDLTDAVYDFNYRLGELADALARIKVQKLEIDSKLEDRREALKYRESANSFYREAGNQMLDYVSRYPLQQGESQRMLRIGNAFYESGDFIFAIDAYQSYFENRREADIKESKATIFFVANRIGEAYMALGLYEGTNLRRAKDEGDETLQRQEEALTSMSLDGALQAFYWAREETRTLLNRYGEGGMPLNTVAPDGGLDSFVNLARARVEQARLMSDPDEKTALYKKTIDELQTDFFENELFPKGYHGFSNSIYWRDARFISGVAAVELARIERAKTSPDSFVFKTWLDTAERAFKNIDSEFSNPIDREIFRLVVNEGQPYDEAIEVAGLGSGKFDDDVFYLSLTYASEVEWLRAIHVDDANRLSDSVVESLRSAYARLEILLEKLHNVQRLERLVGGETISFPDLARQSRYRLGDVAYLLARTMRDRELRNFRREEAERKRLDPTAASAFRMTRATRDLYLKAEDAYNKAEEFDPDSYLAIFALAQKLNAYRALSTGSTNEDAVTYSRAASDLLKRSDTKLANMPDSAFENAPAGMRRKDWETYFGWYKNFDTTPKELIGS